MKTILLPILALSFTPLAFAEEPTAAEMADKTEATIDAEITKIEITGNDQMQFNTKAFEVTAGEEIQLSFKHIGQLPAVAMGHNVVILKPDTDIPAFAAKCAPAKDSEYIPQDPESLEQVVAHTALLGGGEEDEITFTAPEAGEYPFICSFPGHFAIMQGVMTVKAE